MNNETNNTTCAEILTIGNEIVTGLIQDTNARVLADRLNTLGIETTRFTSIGDDFDLIIHEVRLAMQRVDVIILTGGLGATHDDLTKDALAQCFGAKMVKDLKVEEMIKERFRKRDRVVPDLAWKQCEVPDKATVLYNGEGTAPGLLFEQDGKRVYSVPGVPVEMNHLLETYIVPHLESQSVQKILHRVLLTTGIVETALWEKVGDHNQFPQEISLASLPSHLGVRLRMTIAGEDSNRMKELLDQAEQIFRSRVGDYIYGVDDETLEAIIGRLLSEINYKLATAESCTGGLIGNRLTNVPGSSAYYTQGFVTYSNESKEKILGVDPELITRYGAVSEQVARAMVEGVLKSTGVDIAVSVTGIAGPGGGTETKPVGLTYIAVGDANGVNCERFQFPQDRIRNKERAAQAALNMVRQRLQK